MMPPASGPASDVGPQKGKLCGYSNISQYSQFSGCSLRRRLHRKHRFRSVWGLAAILMGRRHVLTAITDTRRTRALRMATMGPTGSRAACSSAPAPGTGAASTVAVTVIAAAMVIAAATDTVAAWDTAEAMYTAEATYTVEAMAIVVASA